MPESKGQRKLAERAKDGDYDLVLPLDAIIMGELPKEGTLFGGLYPIGVSAAQMSEENKLLGQMKLSSTAARLAALTKMGLAVKVRMLGEARGNSYQLTDLGQEVLSGLTKSEPSGDGSE